MEQIDISRWVDQETNPRRKNFRQAIHTILLAISHCEHLHAEMVMKGGLLIAIRYNSPRYTRDIDFSTNHPYAEFDIDAFRKEFDRGLVLATEELDYGLACRIQKCKVNPANPDATWPSLDLRIGYAKRGQRAQIRNLELGRAVNVVQVDYSFNEVTPNIEEVSLSEGGNLQVYTYIDLVAEKIRSVLQQEDRNRYRRQDVFDLYFLINNFKHPDTKERQEILDSLKKKSAEMIDIDHNSMSRPEIIKRSKEEYHLLEDELEDPLPDFDDIYSVVSEFYKSLPW